MRHPDDLIGLFGITDSINGFNNIASEVLILFLPGISDVSLTMYKKFRQLY